ncbi:polysaccharide deacetylase family protein [Segetibacter aerophilus]|uniref:Chitooligosaccharide deacetylase n=1 Tax=Segetibacter aerophilus TaxID=670293 RepID=A0A512BHI0_9BACT|nr:polysaccharide deacetylase family protein [Segetibacter aerophilus]GEO11431.1 chitooligosaccharide deacetylase [Segetibacter aerophilus]
MQQIFLLILISCIASGSFAQNGRLWNNRKCAVSLTYDDAINVDLDNVIPALDSVGLKGSFYLSGYSGALSARIDEWRSIAKNGHELGNHTLYHPCAGGPGRSFVTPDYDLNRYTFRRLVDEIKMTNTLLKAIDGKTKRTFAYPCGDTKIGDSSYVDLLKNDFVAARGTVARMPAIKQIDPYNIECYVINGETGDQLISLVKKAMETNTLLVFLFHGVGGGHSLNVSLQAHSQLLHFLKQNQKDVWTAPMIDIAGYVKDYNKK